MGRANTFIRERRTYCGNKYMTVDIFQRTEEGDQAVRGKRRKKEKVSPPKIKNLNDRNSRRYLSALLNTNFSQGDIHLTLTYSQLPATEEEAGRVVKNYLNRVAYRRKKLGLSPLKYVLVTEYGEKKATGEVVRLHHHIVINRGLSRDDLEIMWTNQRINWAKLQAERQAGGYSYASSIQRLGYANADRLQEGECGFEALARYLTKSPNGKKRWSCSKNLDKPIRATNDSKYSRRRLDKVCSSGEVYMREWWEKAYPGYTLAGMEDQAVEVSPPDEFNGWAVFGRLKKITQRGNDPNGRHRTGL